MRCDKFGHRIKRYSGLRHLLCTILFHPPQRSSPISSLIKKKLRGLMKNSVLIGLMFSKNSLPTQEPAEARSTKDSLQPAKMQSRTEVLTDVHIARALRWAGKKTWKDGGKGGFIV